LGTTGRWFAHQVRKHVEDLRLYRAGRAVVAQLEEAQVEFELIEAVQEPSSGIRIAFGYSYRER